MSRTVTTSTTFNPSSYDTTDHQWNSASSIENGYANTSSTTYSTIYDTLGSRAETWIYYKFDTSSIPDGATINSVSCKAKAYASGNVSNVPSKWMCTFSGTTQKGSTYGLGTSTAVRTLTVGSWTLAEIRDARIKLYAKRGTDNVNTNYVLRMYGAEFTVNYTYTLYSISASSSVSGVTISVSDDEVTSGDSATITITGTLPQGVVVTDNGIDITSVISGSGTTHTYTITNIAEDHVIIIKSAGPTVFLKQNGSWVQAESVFYKQNGVWVQVESMGIKDNGSWIT